MGRIANPELTDKEQAFIDHYIICKNGTKAARLAGYEGDDNALGVRAYELLRNSKIKRVVARRFKETIMQADEILARYKDMAEADLGDFKGVRDLSDLKDHPKSHLVKKLKVTRRIVRNGDDEGSIIEHSEIELHDSKAALDSMAKYWSLTVDKLEISADDKLTTLLKQLKGLE